MSGMNTHLSEFPLFEPVDEERYDPKEKVTSLTPYTRARRGRSWNGTAEINGWLAVGVPKSNDL